MVKIKGYKEVNHAEWRKDVHEDTLHVIRQYYLPNNALCKEVIYFIKEGEKKND